jgi:hypothetical protein
VQAGVVLPAIVAGLLGALVVAIYFRTARKVKVDRLAGRPEQTVHQIYQSFFADMAIPEKRFEELWEELGRVLELPASKLLPTDRFDVELAPPKGYEFDDPIKDVKFLISKYSLRAGVKPEAIQTVRDYIVTFGQDAHRQAVIG